MTFELRPIRHDEVAAFRQAISLGFGGDADEKHEDRFRSLMPLERTVAAFDGDQIVGNLGDFPLQLTVPGGHQVPMAGTTMVGVRATHTRRGILTAMMQRHLDNAVERNEPVAGLWASEPGIYERFGFGLATECHDVTIDSRRLTAPAPDTATPLRMIDAAELHTIVAPYWSKVAQERAGFIDRSPERWQDLINDPEDRRGGASASRHIVAERDGQVVGYLAYRQKDKWIDFTADGTVAINALVASDNDARRALWNYALSVDLFPHVHYWDGDLSDPLAYEASDARAVKRIVSDALYVRILDMAAAITARTYENDGTVVLRVDDHMGYIDGTYQLAVRDGRAEVTAADASPDVVLAARDLGALYLGRDCADLYCQSGRISGDLAAIRTLAQIMRTDRAPWCSEMF